jgi:hypothetical protein
VLQGMQCIGSLEARKSFRCHCSSASSRSGSLGRKSTGFPSVHKLKTVTTFSQMLWLTNSMELSPWEAKVAQRLIPSIVWIPKVHYCVHKGPTLVPVLSQMNSVHTQTSCLRSILISPSHVCLGLPSGVFPSDFPIKTLYVLLFSHTLLHALPISSSSGWRNWVWTENCGYLKSTFGEG